jgi:hypothetical protein
MRRFAVVFVLCLLAAFVLSPVHAAPPTERIDLQPIGAYATGRFGESAAGRGAAGHRPGRGYPRADAGSPRPMHG